MHPPLLVFPEKRQLHVRLGHPPPAAFSQRVGSIEWAKLDKNAHPRNTQKSVLCKRSRIFLFMRQETFIQEAGVQELEGAV